MALNGIIPLCIFCIIQCYCYYACIIEQPQAQHPPTSTHYYEFTSPPEVWDLLVSDASWYHHREAQNHSPEHSLSPFLAGGMVFPPPFGMLDPCQISSNNWKLISFNSNVGQGCSYQKCWHTMTFHCLCHFTSQCWFACSSVHQWMIFYSKQIYCL